MPGKVLMVDDDLVLCKMVQDFLTAKGWRFETAERGGEAVAKARQVQPDLILLDIMLPDMEGWEVCEKLKADEQLKAIPIVMLSGKSIQTQHKVKGLKGGADDYLAKPFSLAVLLAKLEAILRVSPKAQ